MIFDRFVEQRRILATLDVKISIFRYQRCDILSDSTLSISNIWAKIGQSEICLAFGCFFDFDGNFGVDFDSFRSIDWYEVTQWIIICWTVSWIFSGQTRFLFNFDTFKIWSDSTLVCVLLPRHSKSQFHPISGITC